MNVSTDNTPPVADAGPDQTAFVGDTVTLDGSGSSDVDGDPLDFFWSLSAVPQNSQAQLSNPFVVDPSFDVDLAGDYVVQLIVNDGSVDSAPDTVDVTATQMALMSAEDDIASTPSDAAVVIDVLVNDVPAGGVSVVPGSVIQPAHGSVTLNGDGTITYTQAGLSDEPVGLGLYKSKCAGCHALFDFTGIDTFTYAATDGSSSDDATVTVSVSSFDPIGTKGDISGTTPTCSLFDSLSRHNSCAGLGVTDPQLSEISAFLAKGFSSLPVAASLTSFATTALPEADLRLAQLSVPIRVSGQTAEGRSVRLQVSVCNDGPAVSGAVLSLTGVSSVTGVPDGTFDTTIVGLGNGSCGEAAFGWDAPDNGTLMTWTATVRPSGGQDSNPDNNTAIAKTLVYPLR